MQLRSAVVGALLAITLIAGSPAHALIPHEHGDHHHSESIVWLSLHAALKHEDKKALPFFSLLAAVGSALHVSRSGSRIPRTVRVDSITDILRRGIVPYRKFS